MAERDKIRYLYATYNTMTEIMKVLFAGLGSIGQRHLRNLRILVGEDLEILAYRQRGHSHVLNPDMTVRSGADLEETYTREKSIYYDTDGIYESQQETVRVCEVCPGWLRIDSQARGGGIGRRRAWVMCVPWAACPQCAKEGREQYHDMVRTPTAPYDWLYLQDRPADRYRCYDLTTQHEREER